MAKTPAKPAVKAPVKARAASAKPAAAKTSASTTQAKAKFSRALEEAKAGAVALTAGARERALAPLPASFVAAERAARAVRSESAPPGGDQSDLSVFGRRELAARVGRALDDLAREESAVARVAAAKGAA